MRQMEPLLTGRASLRCPSLRPRLFLLLRPMLKQLHGHHPRPSLRLPA